jgi:hypothetical protein
VPGFHFLRYSHSSQQRLGALKTLVALLDTHRSSVASEQIDKKIDALLISAAVKAEDLGWGKRKFPNNQAEALLSVINAPSLLFPITKEKRSRVREWGRLVGLLGNGNQITERGVLLQRLIGSSATDAIRRGDFGKSNPFLLTQEERIYFLYFLLEKDAVLPFLIKRLASLPLHFVLNGNGADQQLTLAMLDLLDHLSATNSLGGSDILAIRDARELTGIMARALSLEDPRAERATSLRRRPRRAGSDPSVTRTNTADDQAIPRFENLVDIGFIVKELPDEEARDPEGSLKRKLSWRYCVTQRLRDWCAVAESMLLSSEFLTEGFAQSARAAFYNTPGRRIEPNEPLAVIDLMQAAYRNVQRVMGHTPLESIALLAMIGALERGQVCEMRTFHAVMLSIKQSGALSQFVKFASGNEIDRMFVMIKPEFFREAQKTLEQSSG